MTEYKDDPGKHNHEDLQDHLGIGIIIKDVNGNILMQDHIKYGFWTIPVEKVKSDETLEEALKIGAKEECNINVLEFKDIDQKNYKYLRSGQKVNVDLHLIEIIKWNGEIKNNEPHKHKEQKFMSINEIEKLPFLSDTTLQFLETLGIKRNAKL
jgi:ADP-ribose pyrophosphatase YjhB (NUDIX family)